MYYILYILSNLGILLHNLKNIDAFKKKPFASIIYSIFITFLFTEDDPL